MNLLKFAASAVAVVLAVGAVPSAMFATNPNHVQEITPAANASGGFQYTNYGTYIEINKYIGSNTEIVIPDNINGIPVTSLSYKFTTSDPYGRFCSKDTISVTIPETVTKIGDALFRDNFNLEYVNIPNSVTSIGEWAFSSCSLTEVVIPDSVKTLGKSAFKGCKLNRVTVGASNIGEDAFYGCRSLTSIEFSENVKSIGNYAFNECDSLTEVVIPETVNTLGNHAFSTCANLNKITVGARSIDDYAFAYNYELSSVTITDNVTSIGNQAFANCESLEAIIIPDSVTRIGGGVFRSCFSLYDVTLSKNITALSNYDSSGFFEFCESLKSITIPDKVSRIGSYCFSGCPLEEINVVKENNTYSSIDGVLFNKIQTELAEYPCAKADESYIVPDTVKTIVRGAFSSNTLLKKITIPDSVESVENYAFNGCTGLEDIIFMYSKCEIYDSEDTISKNASISGYTDSTAEAYANKYNRNFISLGLDPSETTTKPDAPEGLGDANEDGAIDAIDASITLDAYLKKDISEKYNPANADANQNGVVEAADASAILSYYSYIATSWDRVSFSEYMSENRFDNTISETADGGFTAEQIENSPIKPSLYVSQFDLKIKETAGQTIAVNVTLEGADMNWSTSGIHLFYDNRLKLVTDEFERPVTFGKALSDLSKGCTVLESSDSNMNELFIATASSKDYGRDGVIATLNFKIPSNVSIGDEFKIEARYVPDSMFTNTKNDKQGRLMQAYLFTQGLNSGYIKVIDDTATTTTTTTSSTTTTVPTTTTVSASTDVDGNKYTVGTYESLTYWKYDDHVVISECDKSIENIEIPDEIDGLPVTSIGDTAFRWCENLTEINIPDSITSIGLSAFAFCLNLNEITIPDSVNAIGYNAFYLCTDLTKITILNPDCEIYDAPWTISNSEDNDDIIYNGVICGYKNSTAQAYADKYGRTFEPLDAPETTSLTITTTTTTTTTSTSTTSKPTTTQPPVVNPDYNLGDPNKDGLVDAVDASYILALYASISTGNAEPTEFEWNTCDVNKDGFIDAVDASNILAYYAYVSTGGSNSLEGFLGYNQSDNSWKEAYIAEIEAFRKENQIDTNEHYALIYIDNNDVPELYVNSGTLDVWKLFSYVDNEAVCIDEGEYRANHFDGYIEKNGIYLTHSSGSAWQTAYQEKELSDGKISVVNDLWTDYKNLTEYYYFNDTEISQEEWRKKLQEYQEQITEITSYGYDEIKAQLS